MQTYRSGRGLAGKPLHLTRLIENIYSFSPLNYQTQSESVRRQTVDQSVQPESRVESRLNRLADRRNPWKRTGLGAPPEGAE